MLQTLKLNGNEKNIFACADLHIWQSCSRWENPLWKMRGYDSKESHKNGIVKSWNSVCNSDSTCCLLGDNVFEDENGDEFKELLKELNYKNLICLLGNHNSGHGIVYKNVLKTNFPSVFAVGAEVYPLGWNITKDKTVVFLPQYAEVSINKDFFVLSHYPIESHNKIRKGSYCLSGHCHGNLPSSNKDTGSGRRLDVGWDSFARPLSIYEIKEHLKGRDYDIKDHH